MSNVNYPFSQFCKLDLPIYRLIHPTPTPIQYPRASDTFIVTVNSDEDNPGIYKYNLKNNKVELLAKYPSEINVSPYHGHFIDFKHNVLYMYAGEDDKLFVTFNCVLFSR